MQAQPLLAPPPLRPPPLGTPPLLLQPPLPEQLLQDRLLQDLLLPGPLMPLLTPPKQPPRTHRLVLLISLVLLSLIFCSKLVNLEKLNAIFKRTVELILNFKPLFVEYSIPPIFFSTYKFLLLKRVSNALTLSVVRENAETFGEFRG